MKKLSRKQWILVGVVAVVGLGIIRSVTNGGSDLPADKTTLVEEVAPVATIAFDTPLDLGGGVFVTVSSPARFTPTTFMTNIDQNPKTSNSFNVTIKNGGTEPLDFTTVSLIFSRLPPESQIASVSTGAPCARSPCPASPGLAAQFSAKTEAPSVASVASCSCPEIDSTCSTTASICPGSSNSSTPKAGICE